MSMAVRKIEVKEEALSAVTQDELDEAGFHGCVICEHPCPGAQSIYPPRTEDKKKVWKLGCSQYELPVSAIGVDTCEKFWVFIKKVGDSNVVGIKT